MLRILRFSGAAVVAALTFAFAGCASTSSPVPPSVSMTQPAANHVTVPMTGRVDSSQWLAVSSCQPCATFQSGPSSELLFKGTAPNPRRRLHNGIAAPWVGLLFDAFGDLFVANCTTCVTGQAGVNNVVEIKPHANTPAVTITNGITYPFDLAMDAAGTLYASNLGCYSPSCTSTVSEYPRGYTSGPPSAQITVDYPLGLAIDSAQNLYVANCEVCKTGTPGSDAIFVYAPGSTAPSRVISTGVNEPVALAVDSSNDLYVANCMNCGLGAAAYVSGSDSITEYPSGSGTPVKTIAFSAIDVPFSIAVDPSADLYVGNYAANTVTEYPPNAVNPSKTIANGISSPASLAVNSSGALYVSNAGANTVTEYSANYRGGRPKATLSVAYPSSIAVWH